MPFVSRVLVSAGVLAAALFFGAGSAVAHDGSGERARQATRGLVPAGPGSPCREIGYEVRVGGEIDCTHGPDPAPPGVDLGERLSEVDLPAAAEADGVVPCIGDGASGNRVQVVHVVASGAASVFPDPTSAIRGYVDVVNARVRDGAAETGGIRDVRFVTDAECRPVVEAVSVSAGAMADFRQMVGELRAAGLNRSDRKYLVWAESTAFCGIALMEPDDRPRLDNGNNGDGGPALFARVDLPCWAHSTGLHELLHTLGAVQSSAPNATPSGHCRDEWDVMCYADGPGVTTRVACLRPQALQALDCNHDDYFHTAPPLGTYLASHWNTANSSFLEGGDQTAPSPPGNVRFTSITEDSIALTWEAGADDAGLAGYELYANGVSVATAARTSATVGRLVCGRTYLLGVEAIDLAGNHSSRATATVATAACIDRRAPVAVALPARGTRGKVVRLRFQVTDESETRAVVTVFRNRRGLVRRVTGFGFSAARSVAWRAPARGRGFRFCVRAFDLRGNESAPSCAPITLRWPARGEP